MQIAGQRPPQTDAARSGRDVVDLHVVRARAGCSQSRSRLPFAPTWNRRRAEPRDRQVAAHAAVLVQQQRVDDRAGLAVEVVGRHGCRNSSAPGPLTSSRFNGVMSNIATRLRVTSASAPADRRPEPARPLVARRAPRPTSGRSALASYQCGRSQPDASRKSAPSSCCLLVERTRAHRPRTFHGLQRMQHVVDLDEVLAAAFQHVVRRQLHLLEPVEVARVQVQLGLPVDDPLGHRPRHPGGVRDPHRLRDPEPLEVGMFAQQRHPVAW